MTGIADLYLYVRRPYSKDRRQRLLTHWIRRRDEPTRFVVLAWKRTGSNLLCGILFHHPEVLIHNEIFNTIDILTYSPDRVDKTKWSVLARDLHPEEFLEEMWSGADRTKHKAVGFKSFPEHWSVVRNDEVFERALMANMLVKKIVLKRDDELAVYVSMLRAEQTTLYLGRPYPPDLKVRVDPVAFQAFLMNYRNTYNFKYKSPTVGRDTFLITYEQLSDETKLHDVIPKLWHFLGVDPTVKLRKLQETIKQADPNEDLRNVITNYDELEFCFRHSDVTHFREKRKQRLENAVSAHVPNVFDDEKAAYRGGAAEVPLKAARLIVGLIR